MAAQERRRRWCASGAVAPATTSRSRSSASGSPPPSGPARSGAPGSAMGRCRRGCAWAAPMRRSTRRPARAAELLRAGPALVYLAPGLATEAQRAAIALADIAGARLDSVTSDTGRAVHRRRAAARPRDRHAWRDPPPCRPRRLLGHGSRRALPSLPRALYPCRRGGRGGGRRSRRAARRTPPSGSPSRPTSRRRRSASCAPSSWAAPSAISGGAAGRRGRAGRAHDAGPLRRDRARCRAGGASRSAARGRAGRAGAGAQHPDALRAQYPSRGREPLGRGRGDHLADRLPLCRRLQRSVCRGIAPMSRRPRSWATVQAVLIAGEAGALPPAFGRPAGGARRRGHRAARERGAVRRRWPSIPAWRGSTTAAPPTGSTMCRSPSRRHWPTRGRRRRCWMPSPGALARQAAAR